MKGYRNLLIIIAFLLWCLGETAIIVYSVDTLTEGIVTSLGVLLAGVGGGVVGGMFARGYKAGKVVE